MAKAANSTQKAKSEAAAASSSSSSSTADPDAPQLTGISAFLTKGAAQKGSAVDLLSQGGGSSHLSSQPRPQTFIQQKGGRKRNERVRYPIHYAYQEGFTNAVRRPMKVRDLFGPIVSMAAIAGTDAR
jgi:hypothetical protein